MIDLFIITIYFVASLFLFSYGVNCYVMVWLYLKTFKKGRATNALIEQANLHIWDNPQNLPRVTTQIPLYNELNVAERVMRAASAMNYPAGMHEVQILDDLNDETSLLDFRRSDPKLKIRRQNAYTIYKVLQIYARIFIQIYDFRGKNKRGLRLKKCQSRIDKKEL